MPDKTADHSLTWKLGLAVCAGALVGSAAAHVLLGLERDSRPLATASAPDPALAEIAGELRQITTLLRARPQAEPALQSADRRPAASVAPDATAALSERLARTAEQVERSVQRLEAAAVTRAADVPLHSITRPRDESALESLAKQDGARRKADLMFLSQADALARFGQPDSMYGKEGGVVHWLYTEEGTRPKIILVFLEGRISEVWGE